MTDILIKPLVSVIMPIYNGAAYVADAVESLRSQTLSNLEIIIVDDGSTDETPAIIDRFAKMDSRIQSIRCDKIGFALALNVGIEQASCRYIARMDADDVCLPQRLAIQTAYLDANRDVYICGSWVQTFGGNSEQLLQFPVNWEEIKCALLFYSAVCHPTAVFRREVFDEGFNYNAAYAEAADYKLWSDCVRQLKIVNIPEVLLRYRLHSAQVTQADAPRQQIFARQIRSDILAPWIGAFTQKELDIHNNMGNWNFAGDLDFVQQSENWLLRLVQANRSQPRYAKSIFLRMVSHYWYRVCSENVNRVGCTIPFVYRRSPLVDAVQEPQLSWKTAKLCLKLLLASAHRK